MTDVFSGGGCIVKGENKEGSFVVQKRQTSVRDRSESKLSPADTGGDAQI